MSNLATPASFRADQPIPAVPNEGDPPPVRFPLLVRFLLAATGVTAAWLIDPEVFAPVILLFLIVVPFEKLYPRKRGQRIRRPLAATDVTFALLSPVLNVVGLSAILVIGGLSLFWVPGLLLRPVVAQLHPVVAGVAAFALFDFLGYWTHRWAHEVPFLWRFHAVHHSPEHMDWISGFRIHPFDGILVAPGVFFLLAAGFDAELTGLLAVAQIILGLFFHANVRVRWRWLDRLVANPEFHHWHHANEPDAIGHNYAPALPAWDLVFGTFFMPKSDRRPQFYGVDQSMPQTLGGLLIHPVRGARQLVGRLRHPIRAARALVIATRALLSEVWTSTTRSTHAVRRLSAPGCHSTNASLFDPDEAPGRSPVIRF